MCTVFVKGPRGLNVRNARPQQINIDKLKKKSTQVFFKFLINVDESDNDVKDEIWYKIGSSPIKGIPAEKQPDNEDNVWSLE